VTPEGPDARDHVDHILQQWARVRRDLDVSPMGIVGRISRLSRFLEHSTATVLAQYGLNEPQFAVLAAVRRAGPPYRMAPSDLYDALLVSSGAMTNRLDRLAAVGLIERVPDTHDGRSLLIALTREGYDLIEEVVVAAHTANEQRRLANLSPAERMWLASKLRKLLLQFDDRPRPARRRGPSNTPTPAGHTDTGRARPDTGR
jgi:DNA-binding MarR family transcriptional regulator